MTLVGQGCTRPPGKNKKLFCWLGLLASLNLINSLSFFLCFSLFSPPRFLRVGSERASVARCRTAGIVTGIEGPFQRLVDMMSVACPWLANKIRPQGSLGVGTVRLSCRGDSAAGASVKVPKKELLPSRLGGQVKAPARVG